MACICRSRGPTPSSNDASGLTWTCQFDGWVYFLRPGCLFQKEKPTGVYLEEETPVGVYFGKERPLLNFLKKETPVGVYL